MNALTMIISNIITGTTVLAGVLIILHESGALNLTKGF
jgi:hypothetical protein